MKSCNCGSPQPSGMCSLSFPWQHYWLSIPNCQWTGLQDERKGQTCVRGGDVEEGRGPCPSFYFPGGTTEKEIGKPSSCPTGNPVLVHLRPLFVTQLPIWLMQSLRQRLSELSSHQAAREFSQDSYQFPCFLQLAPFNHTVLNHKNKYRICWWDLLLWSLKP